MYIATDMQGIIINKEGSEPYKQLVKHSPQVNIETVVRGVMMLIEDEKRNGNVEIRMTYISLYNKYAHKHIAETLLTLPGDVIRVQEPIATYGESYINMEHSCLIMECYIRGNIDTRIRCS